MTEELFNKYVQNLCNDEEKATVEAWLENCTDEELTVLLEPRWNAFYTRLPEKYSLELWRGIYSQVDSQNAVENIPQHRTVLFKRSRWIAAASILAVFVSVYYLYQSQVKPVAQISNSSLLASSTDHLKWTTIKNSNSKPKKIQLADESEVELFPASSIEYASDYNIKERNIILKGKAIFTVAKNKQKPFTVFSGDIATTAVGTRFIVSGNNLSGSVTVKLFEGLIKIRSTNQSLKGWDNGRLLYPGQEVIFEQGIAKTNSNPKNSEFLKPAEINHTKGTTELGDEIIFSNTPLSEVFETMEKLFRIKISWVNNDLLGMTLTTNINRNDNPVMILNAVAQMNQLSIQKTTEGFIVTKSQ